MDKMWFYAQSGRERQGPVPEAQIREMLADGRLRGSDLVWAEGMSNWTPAQVALGISDPAPAPSANMAAPLPAGTPRLNSTPMAASVAGLPEGLTSWMQFVGVMTLIGGIFYCLSCFGIIYGVLMIMAGVAVMGARNALLAAPEVPASMRPFMDKLKSYFLMTGIFFIIMIVLSIISIIMMFVYFGLLLSFITSAAGGMAH